MKKVKSYCILLGLAVLSAISISQFNSGVACFIGGILLAVAHNLGNKTEKF